MLKVVLIEDDPMVQEVNRQFVDKVQGFRVAGVASNGSDGIELVRKIKPDLVLIDVFMPLQGGLETLQLMRSENMKADVIAITAASDVQTVRGFLQQGAFDYIVKPFKFERIKRALENYRSFRAQFDQKDSISQKELDEIFFQTEKEILPDLPKGLNNVTLGKIIDYLSEVSGAISAEEVAEGVGIARVTARRYLDYLEKGGRVEIDIHYGGIGRPINKYLLVK